MSILWSEHPVPSSHALLRRGIHHGYIADEIAHQPPESDVISADWWSDQAVNLPDAINVGFHKVEIQLARKLMERILEGETPTDMIVAHPYSDRLSHGMSGADFVLAGTIHDEGDPQEIEKIYFDAEINGEAIAEDLWCKVSWLSYHEEDASLRFRFSFGMEDHEDVTADPERQLLSAQLCDALFPESASITENPLMRKILAKVLGGDPAFVERIVYFNAPNGGAQFHHDVERGHAGVVYAQMSGSTFWLALGKQVLIDEIVSFVNSPVNENDIARALPSKDDRNGLQALICDRRQLTQYMDAFDHELIEALIDRSPAFTSRLIEKGYGHILRPGDAILLPQRDLDVCVWHSVFCLGHEPGEGLSFAVRKSS